MLLVAIQVNTLAMQALVVILPILLVPIQVPVPHQVAAAAAAQALALLQVALMLVPQMLLVAIQANTHAMQALVVMLLMLIVPILAPVPHRVVAAVAATAAALALALLLAVQQGRLRFTLLKISVAAISPLVLVAMAMLLLPNITQAECRVVALMVAQLLRLILDSILSLLPALHVLGDQDHLRLPLVDACYTNYNKSLKFG